MKAFTYHCPTEIIFGKNSEYKIARYVRKYGGTRVFLVYGRKSAVKSGLIARICQEFEEEEIAYETFGGVKPNPIVEYARMGVCKAIEFQADMIIGIGGGSAIDTAKAIAHGAANEGTDLWDLWTGNARLRTSLPIGAILTIPASGSEMSDSAVLTDEAARSKRNLSTIWNRPRFALLNPELALTLPVYQIGCGVADIMMHTMERYFENDENKLTDAIAEALLRTVIDEGLSAIKNPADYNSMSELMWAGSLSHNGLTGLGRIGDWACHMLGHELSAMFDLAHGASLTAVWRAWAYDVYRENIGCFEHYAQKVWGSKQSGEKAALEGIAATVAYFRKLGMPTTIGEAVGIQDDDVIRQMADHCSQNGNITIGRIKVLDRKDIYRIYYNANVE